MAEDAAWHILADLELAGIRETKGRDQQKKHKPEELGKRALSETED